MYYVRIIHCFFLIPVLPIHVHVAPFYSILKYPYKCIFTIFTESMLPLSKVFLRCVFWFHFPPKYPTTSLVVRWLWKSYNQIKKSILSIIFPRTGMSCFHWLKHDTWLLLIFLCPIDENSYMASMADAWFHPVFWTSYVQQNAVLEKIKRLSGLLLIIYGNILGWVISQMALLRLAICEIAQPNIFP